MVIDSKTTDSNAADNVDSVLVCEAWLPARSNEWNRCLRAFDLQTSAKWFGFFQYRHVWPRAGQLESELWERPQFPHNRVPLGGWEFDGWVSCGPFPVFCFWTKWTVSSELLVLLPAMTDSCAWDASNDLASSTALSSVSADPLLISFSLFERVSAEHNAIAYHFVRIFEIAVLGEDA